MEQTGPHIDEARVARFEKKIGHRLPDDYRTFLLSVNGGVPEDLIVAPDGSSTGTLLQVFQGLETPEDGMDLEACLAVLQLREQGQFPAELLQIANDGLGNKFVLAVAGERRGQVFFLALDQHPERRMDTEWYHSRQFKKVADSFDAFIAALRVKA